MSDTPDRRLETDALSGYLDDELDAEARAEVEARLAESAEWRAELEEVRAARAAVRVVSRRDAPDGFWARVHEVVEAASTDDSEDAPRPTADVTPITAARGTRRRRIGRIVVAAAAAVAAVAVTVAVLPGRHTVRPNVAAITTQHAASAAGAGEPISALAPTGPLAGFR
jgi:anti-sigma factor RsiW